MKHNGEMMVEKSAQDLGKWGIKKEKQSSDTRGCSDAERLQNALARFSSVDHDMAIIPNEYREVGKQWDVFDYWKSRNTGYTLSLVTSHVDLATAINQAMDFHESLNR